MSDSSQRRRFWWASAAFLLLLVAVGTYVFFKIGDWLIVQDPLAPADAIVILSGRLPERALEAARLYQAGYAGQVWITPPDSAAEELRQMNIVYLGEDFYNEKVLIAHNVPASAIRVLDPPVVNTEDEVLEISRTLRETGEHSVIVVTSKPHTRRVRAIWRRLVGADPRAIVRFTSDDPYDGRHWWRHTHDALDVLRETLGLLNVWAGFPLRPNRY